MNLKVWARHFRMKLNQIDDTPNAIALGIAVGIFFGFTPLFGLKTLLAIALAWALGANKIAAAIAVTLHDVLLPILPILLRWEYDIGYFLLSNPHELPPHMHLHHEHSEFGAFLHWSTFLSYGLPILIGAVIIGVPVSIISYYVARWAFKKRETRKEEHARQIRIDSEQTQD